MRGAVAESPAAADAEYVAGIARSVGGFIEDGASAIESGGAELAPMSEAMAIQVRRAAHLDISLQTITRRCSLAHHVFVRYAVEEAQSDPDQTLVVLGAWLDHVLDSIATEYNEELDRLNDSGEQRRLDRVQKLLASSSADAPGLGYSLDAFHVGLVASGKKAAEAVQDLAQHFNRELLSVKRTDDTCWAWLGGQRHVASALFEQHARAHPRQGVTMAIGEPGEGATGWRLTHRQAAAAMTIAFCRADMLACYGNELLLASVATDTTLHASLRQMYLAPLDAERDEGRALRTTLRAYFAVQRNAATAAHALKVNRHTVERRLRRVEERIGRTIQECAAELELALRIEELGLGADSAVVSASAPRHARAI
jgi:hypothetical protein